MHIRGIDEILYREIEIVCSNRLKKSVSPFEVMSWLQNFKKEEYYLALRVLENLDVYTENELIELWDERLKVLLQKVPKNVNIIFNNVAEFGKSGTLMMYYIKKTPSYKSNEKRIAIYSSPEQIKYKKRANSIPAKSIIVLIDDFAGSGNSALNYYLHFIKPQIKNFDKIIDVYFVLLFSLDKAVNLFKRKASEAKLICEIKIMAFSLRGSVFGYREKMLLVREFCFKYGKGLFITENKKRKTIDHPLGFENSQALIIFPYNPPNNTIPILWSNQGNWRPLYPRNSIYKISEAKKIRKELASYISLLNYTEFDFDFKTGQQELPWKTVSFVTKTDFLSFSILFLLRRKRPQATICQILGITEIDFLRQIEELKARNVMDKGGVISNYGEEVYLEVLKQLRKQRNLLKDKRIYAEIKSINYLPKQFRGRSLIN